jgi:hypothetical protein
MRALLSAAATAAAFAFVFSAAGRAADEWGTVKGQVTWGGKEVPKPEKIAVDKDKEHCLSKGDLFKEEFVVGKDGGVKNVFVWLQKGADYKAKLPTHPDLKAVKGGDIVIDQPCCKFEPHALAIREGQKIIGKNSSPIAHNMKWAGGDENPGDNKLIPSHGQIEIDLVTSKSPVKVECNIHPWMNGWVRVFYHPYFAVTDADGKFVIKNAPAGKYNIVMWQEGVGWVNGGKTGQEIEIPANGTVEVNEKLKPEEK